MRRLEVRIGQLLGPAERDHDRPAGAKSVVTDISKDQRHEFRQMASHPEVVEQVIAGSSLAGLRTLENRKENV